MVKTMWYSLCVCRSTRQGTGPSFSFQKKNVTVKTSPLIWFPILWASIHSFEWYVLFSASWTTNSFKYTTFFCSFHQFNVCLLCFTFCKWIKFKETLNHEIGWSQRGWGLNLIVYRSAFCLSHSNYRVNTWDGFKCANQISVIFQADRM